MTPVNERQWGVCHLLLSYYPRTGGAEIQARRLIAYQRAQGWSTCVVARRRLADPGERAWPSYEEIDGSPVYRVPVWGEGRLAALTYGVLALGQLVRLRRRYQVIHAHMITAPAIVGGAAGRALGKKVVTKVSSGGTGSLRVPDNLSSLRASSLAWLRCAWLKRTVDGYWAISRSIADELRALGLPPDRIVQIPNGVDVHRFAPSAEPPEVIRARLGLPSGPLLVYVGHLRTRKNLGVLIQALPLLRETYPSLSLALVGAEVRRTEGEQARLERLGDELGVADRVLLVPHTRDVLPYLHAASLFAIPSHKEGLSNAMLEAMAAGLPVVSTRVSGAEDLIQDGKNGVLVSLEATPAEVAKAIDSVLQDPDRAGEMGRRARQTVAECCSFEIVGNRILELYQDLLVKI